MARRDHIRMTSRALAPLLLITAAGLAGPAGPASAATIVVYENDFSGEAGPEWSADAGFLMEPGVYTLPLGERMLAADFLGAGFDVEPFGGADSVNLTLEALPAHDSVRIQFDLYVLATWEGNGEGCCGPDFWMMEVVEGPTLQPTTTFVHPDCGNGSSQSYPDPYLAANPALTGAEAFQTLGFGEGDCFTDSTYHFDFTFAHAADMVDFLFDGDLTSGWEDEGWGLDNVMVSVETPEEPEPVGADLAALKAGPGSARPGVPMTYTIGAINFGPEDAKGVAVTDELPAKMRLLSMTGGCTGVGSIRCPIGKLRPGQSKTFVITVLPKRRGPFENTAVVTSRTLDLEPANDSATVMTLVS